MLRDRFASLKWKTISCLDETFPWMLSINWALKLLTRNSGLPCLKTQSGSWKHCRLFDLQKLASSMRLLTALFVWYWGRAIQNNSCLSIMFFLSLSLSGLALFPSLTCLFLSLFVSLLLAPLSLPLSLATHFLSHTFTHISFSFHFFIACSSGVGPVKVLQSWAVRMLEKELHFFVTHSDN